MSSLPLTHLSLREDEVPDGVIRQGPERSRRRRFAFAIPTLAVMTLIPALSAFAAIPATHDRWLTLGDGTGMAAFLVTTVMATLAGVQAARVGWAGQDRTGPWRPLAFGLGAGLTVLGTGWAVLAAAAVAA